MGQVSLSRGQNLFANLDETLVFSQMGLVELRACKRAKTPWNIYACAHFIVKRSTSLSELSETFNEML